MAGLLNNNFKKWLANSAMSPIQLTEELDTDKDGVISGDEFATLLGKMTGERPPEWVVELVFSFVNANPTTVFLLMIGWRFWPPAGWNSLTNCLRKN